MMSVMAVAQPGKPSKKTPQERAGNQTERLFKELSLTPEQAAKVKEILSSKVTEMDSLRAKKMAGAEKKDVLTDRKVAKEKTNAELKAVLTPEQYAKLKAMQEVKKENSDRANVFRIVSFCIRNVLFSDTHSSPFRDYLMPGINPFV